MLLQIDELLPVSSTPKTRLFHNRSVLGCLVVIACTTLLLFLFWLTVPNEVILRHELESQNYRGSVAEVKKMGPEAIPILMEYISHENIRTRITAIHTTGSYIRSHPNERTQLVSALCQRALHDTEKMVRMSTIEVLRTAKFHSKEIDNTTKQLIDDDDEDIKSAAIDMLVMRLEVSTIACEYKKQLVAYIKKRETKANSQPKKRLLRMISDKCEGPKNK